jgi:conjugative transfer signal peptidase TraF
VTSTPSPTNSGCTSRTSSQIAVSVQSNRARVLIRRLLGATIFTTVVSLAATHLTWNLTPSEPRGLYLLLPWSAPRRGDFVTFSIPSALTTLVRTRHYLPPRVQLLKRLVALFGDHVCIDDQTYAVNYEVISSIAHADAAGRPLVPVIFCGQVPEGRAFVASPAPSSLDSRYFGSIPLTALTRAYPLWTY